MLSTSPTISTAREPDTRNQTKIPNRRYTAQALIFAQNYDLRALESAAKAQGFT